MSCWAKEPSDCSFVSHESHLFPNSPSLLTYKRHPLEQLPLSGGWKLQVALVFLCHAVGVFSRAFGRPEFCSIWCFRGFKTTLPLPWWVTCNQPCNHRNTELSLLVACINSARPRHEDSLSLVDLDLSCPTWSFVLAAKATVKWQPNVVQLCDVLPMFIILLYFCSEWLVISSYFVLN